MAKNKNRNRQQNNPSQMSKQDRVEALREQVVQQREEEIAKDDRVQARLQELEDKKKEYEDLILKNEEVLEAQRKELKEEFDVKKLELDEQEDRIDKAKSDIKKMQADVEEQKRDVERIKAEVREEEIARIKADEATIRDEEYKRLLAEVESKRVEAQGKIDEDREKAHAMLMEAEETKREKIGQANELIQKKQEEFSAEYQKKLDAVSDKMKELRRLQDEAEERKREADEDSEYFAELRAKYGTDTTRKIDALNDQIADLSSRIEALQARLTEVRNDNSQLRSYMRDDNGESLLAEIADLKLQLEESQKKADELANMPSEKEIAILREKAQCLEDAIAELDEERSKREEAERKLSTYALSVRELENARVSAAALESLNNQLQAKLKQISNQYKETQESKFKTLLEIDESVDKQTTFIAKGNVTSLAELVKYIRNYGAAKKENKLFYSEETIRVFLASIATAEPASRLLILQGLSGTGKSSLPRLVAESIGAECKLVAVQPSWRDNRELLGYDNDFTNRFKETEFTKYLYEASAPKNSNKIFFIVLDEMNLARVEYYFADFLSTLEKPDQSEWIIPLVSGYSEFSDDQKPTYLNYSNEAANICVTRNVWFVGTANNDDSTSLITDKVYDRAQIMDMDTRETEFTPGEVSRITMDVDQLIMMFEAAKTSTSGKLTTGDWEKINQIDEDCLKEMEITFGNRIKKQLEDFVPVYVACGGSKFGAVDYILTHKILRKLDERYEPYLVKQLANLKNSLNDIFGEGVFKQSIAKIDRLCYKINPGN